MKVGVCPPKCYHAGALKVNLSVTSVFSEPPTNPTGQPSDVLSIIQGGAASCQQPPAASELLIAQ